MGRILNGVALLMFLSFPASVYYLCQQPNHVDVQKVSKMIKKNLNSIDKKFRAVITHVFKEPSKN